MAVDSNAPTVTLGFCILAVPPKPLPWAVHAGLTAVPSEGWGAVRMVPGGTWDPTALQNSWWPNTSRAQGGLGSAPSWFPG